MKNFLFSTIFILTFINIWGQNNVSDTIVMVRKNSIDNGEFSMSTNKSVLKLLNNRVNASCKKGSGGGTGGGGGVSEYEDLCKTNTSIMGYKIQIYYSKDRKAAESIKNEVSTNFPSLHPELVYASPDYKVLAGDYYSQESAQKELNFVRHKYPSAFIVQWRIWCRRAR